MARLIGARLEAHPRAGGRARPDGREAQRVKQQMVHPASRSQICPGCRNEPGGPARAPKQDQELDVRFGSGRRRRDVLAGRRRITTPVPARTQIAGAKAGLMRRSPAGRNRWGHSPGSAGKAIAAYPGHWPRSLDSAKGPTSCDRCSGQWKRNSLSPSRGLPWVPATPLEPTARGPSLLSRAGFVGATCPRASRSRFLSDSASCWSMHSWSGGCSRREGSDSSPSRIRRHHPPPARWGRKPRWPCRCRRSA